MISGGTYLPQHWGGGGNVRGVQVLRLRVRGERRRARGDVRVGVVGHGHRC